MSIVHTESLEKVDERQLLAAVFHSIHDALIICRANMQLVMANQYAQRTLPRLKRLADTSLSLCEVVTNAPDDLKRVFAHSLACDHDIPCKLTLKTGETETSEHQVTLHQLKLAAGVPEYVLVKILRTPRASEFRFRDMQMYLAQHHQQMSNQYGLANRDALTSLYNRRYFESVAERHLSLSKMNGSQCLALFDLDHFKRINDTYGHDVGDEVLVSVARTLNSHCRNTDIACRWGGEEFVILLTNTRLTDAVLILERLKQTVSEQVFTADRERFHVTVSVGVVQILAEESMNDCFNRCDQALYEAKASGRNNLVVG